MIRHRRMRIDPAYRSALSALGLDQVDRVLSRVEGRVVAWSRTTDTLYVPGARGGPGFYVKRYYYPRWRNRLRGMFRGTWLGTHRGVAEYRLLRAMRTLGIPAVRPVAHGSLRSAGFVVAGFLITEEAPASQNLTEFAQAVQARRIRMTPQFRFELAWRLAQMTAAAHGADFRHGQLFWRNIVLRTDPTGNPELLLLDARPRQGRRRLHGKARWQLEELAQLAASALPFSTRTDRLRFLRSYVEAVGEGTARALWHDVATAARRHRKHEDRRIRMNEQFSTWNRRLAEEQRALTAELEAAALGPSAAEESAA